MDRREADGIAALLPQNAPTSLTQQVKPPTAIAVVAGGKTTSLALPLAVPGTVFVADGQQSLYVADAARVVITITASETVTITPGAVITVAGIPSTVVAATSSPTTSDSTGTITSQSSGSSPSTSNGALQSTSSTSTTAPTGGVAAVTTKAFGPTEKPTTTKIGTIGALFPGNTFVYTPTQNTEMVSPIAMPKAGLKSGAAAGLAIGMLIAGALIAALACFLLFSRKNKRNAAKAGRYEPTVYADEQDLKHPTKISSTPLGAIGAAAIIENNLPQPKEDNAIIGDLSRIKSRIEGHVDSYYHTAGANNQAVAQALNAACGTAFPVPIVRLQELLSNPRKRPAVLRAAIAWIIISRIDFGSGPDTTFLPTHVTGATRDLSASRMDEPTRVAFLSKWRQITAALSGNTFTEDMPADDLRLVNINNALHLADTFLRPCAKDGDHEKRLANLEAIMKRASRFGFLLFSQPSSFHFDWSDGGSGLVVFPGLLQVSDDNGRPVGSPRTFGQKEVVPM